MVFSSVEAFAPATVANLGVGFDILGMALAGMGDKATVSWRHAPGIVISRIVGDAAQLPRDPKLNVAAVSAQAMLSQLGEKRGLEIELVKGLPLASGLGSSAASAVVTVIALNELLGKPFTREQLLPFCLEGEALVSGYHADNVAPCLLGGLVLVAGITVDAMQPLPVPADMHLALATPAVAVPTNQARALLPANVSLRQLIHQTGMVGRLVDALHRGDLQALGAAMESDLVIEPARASLMPLLAEMRAVAKEKGAIALFIGGAGPTLCALCDCADVARRVADAMQSAYQAANLQCIAQATRVDSAGATVLRAQ